MFYTDSISYNAEKPSLWVRIVKHFERSGYLRAEAELIRLGYHDEALKIRRELNRLK